MKKRNEERDKERTIDEGRFPERWMGLVSSVVSNGAVLDLILFTVYHSYLRLGHREGCIVNAHQKQDWNFEHTREA